MGYKKNFFLTLFFLGIFTCHSSYSNENENSNNEITLDNLQWNSMTWVKNLMKDDSKNTLQNMKLVVDNWREFEHFVDQWNIEFTEMYKGPNENERRKYITKNFFRFADQKLSDHLKSKDKDKNEAALMAGRVRAAANPKLDLSVMNSFKLRFRAKPLLGEAYLFLENPIVKSRAEFYTNSPIKIVVEKDLGIIWDLKTEVNYQIQNQVLTTLFRANISNYLQGVISNAQRFKPLENEDQMENRIELIFSKRL